MEKWIDGAMECWNIGVLEYWIDGVKMKGLGYSNNPLLQYSLWINA
jgi:hypothetical protein